MVNNIGMHDYDRTKGGKRKLWKIVYHPLLVFTAEDRKQQ